MNCAVLLCGCGHMDGSEIRESVFVMLELDRLGVEFTCCSVNDLQVNVVNHMDSSVMSGETRNMMEESSRISRGNMLDIKCVRASEFDMLIIPGGFGVIKNFSNLLTREQKPIILESVRELIIEFHRCKKAIGGVCISPAVIACSLSTFSSVQVTLGEDRDGIVSRVGGEHVPCKVDDFVLDSRNLVFSCPAYMLPGKISEVHLGIQKMVTGMVEYTRKNLS